MSIAHTITKRSKPRRSGMKAIQQHAALTGLESIILGVGGYRHVAPPELLPSAIGVGLYKRVTTRTEGMRQNRSR